MTSRRLPGHLLALLLLFYVTADFMDPLMPGAFSFQNDALLVDSVVKSKASTDLMPTEPMMPSARPADCDHVDAVAKVRTVARLLRPPRIRWKNVKHDDSASFASSSPPDSSPTPPQS